MKNKIYIVCTITFLVFLFIPLAINALASIPNPYIKGNPNTVEATWIAFWGSYGGGFFSSLIGAGISGLVAYYLIGKETKENRDSQILLAFSLKFNEDYQDIKKDIIQTVVDVHICLQNYHIKLIEAEQLVQSMNELLEKCREMQNRLHQTINIHVLLMQYVKEKNPGFDPNLLCNIYADLVLQYNKIRMEYTKAIQEKLEYDIIKVYNNHIICMVNKLRELIIETEYEFIHILFPSLQTEKKFTLTDMEQITENDYDSLMQKHQR